MDINTTQKYYLNLFSFHVLCTVYKLKSSASSTKIREDLSERMQREVSTTQIHRCLNQLLTGGFLVSTEKEPTHVRGGRRKKIYTLTQESVDLLNHNLKLLQEVVCG